MTVALAPELENWVLSEAKREGVSPEEIVRRTVETQWQFSRHISRLTTQESALLERINQGFSEEFWQRFHELRNRLNTGVITSPEYQEYLQLIEQTENRNVERMEALLALSQLRGVTPTETLHSLGISSRAH